MAKSLDKLIDFLLDEIALGGDEGVNFRDIAGYTRCFYTPPDPPPSTSSQPIQSFTVDRAFLAKLWQWLNRYDDISVGTADSLRGQSYSQVEAQYPDLTNAILHDASISSSGGGQASDQAAHKILSSDLADGPSFVASLDRIHYAVCGHGPDPTRVFPSEYTLLCAIAGARHNGILQGELGRSTGQDKRSVPKRTDTLQQKGYIVKRTVWTGGHRTSRLFLRRFANSDLSAGAQTVKYRLRDLARQVFSALKENTFTTQDELATSLSIVDDARKRVLSQVIRHFVQKKCLKKVRVARGHGSDARDLRTCIQFLRDPAEGDYLPPDGGMLNLDTAVEDAVVAARQALAGSDNAEPDDDLLEGSNMPQHDLVDAARHMRPQWNPDRILTNALFDLTSNAGEEGLTNTAARLGLTGVAVRRPVESLLTRLSHGSLKAQPAAVRDLSLLRSWEVQDSVGRFVHRTFNVYRSLAEQGRVQWSSVVGGKEFAKDLKSADPEHVGANSERDEFGFLKRQKPKGLLPIEPTDLEQIAQATNAVSHALRVSDPLIQEEDDASMMVVWKPADGNGGVHSRSSTPRPARIPTKTNKPQKDSQKVAGIGRRRKFAKGAEKFWRLMFLSVLKQRDPSYPANGMAGMMNDPDCLQMYQSRPGELDDMVVKALAHGLPVPTSFREATQAWIDHMKHFFARQSPGVYFAPTGMANLSLVRRSCIVTVRTSRLSEVDFGHRSELPAVLLFSSSAAHTFRHLTGSWARGWLEQQSVEGPTARKSEVSNEDATSREKSSERAASTVTAAPTRHEQSKSNSPANETIQHSPHRKRRLSQMSIQDGETGLDLHSSTTTSGLTKKPRKLPSTENGGKRSIDLLPSKPQTRLISSSRRGRQRKPTQKAIEAMHTAQMQQSDPQDTEANDCDPESSCSSPAPALQLGIRSTVQDEQWGDMAGPEPSVRPPMAYNPRRALSQPLEERIDGVAAPGPSSTASYGAESGQARHVKPSLDGIAGDVDTTDAKIATEERTDISASARTFPKASIMDSAISIEPPGVPHGRENNSIPTQGHSPSDTSALGLEKVVSSTPANIRQHRTSADQEARPISTPTTSMSQDPDKLTSGDALPDDSSLSHGENKVYHKTGAPQLAITEHENGVDVIDPDQAQEGLLSTNHHAPPVQASTEDHTGAPPRQIRTRILIGRDAVEYYRAFIMELVHLCGGLIPYGPPMLKRAMKAKCAEAQVDSEPNIKLVKSQVTILINRNKLKFMHFAFQRRGFNHTKTIAALPHFQPADPQVKALQDKISSLPYEEDYIPPELQMEMNRQPSRFDRRDPALEPDGASSRNAMSKPKTKPQKKQNAARRRTESSTPSVTPRLSVSPPAPAPSPNVGFLTLKVPKIATIHTDKAFTSHYFELSAGPLRFNTSQTASPTPAPRQSGTRNPNDTTRNHDRGKIQWPTSKTVALPTSLRSILSHTFNSTNNTFGGSNGVSTFERAVCSVAEWEERVMSDLKEPKPGKWNFINHLMPVQVYTRVPLEGDLVFRMLSFENDQELENELPEAESWPVFAEVVASLNSKQRKAAAATEKRKRRFEDVDEDDGDHEFSDSGPSDTELPPRKRVRRAPTRRAAMTKKRKSIAGSEQGTPKRTRLQPRGIGMRHLPPDKAHQLGVAFVVVKVLAGGLDRYLDFNLVKRLIPEESESMLKERWKVLSTRYNNDIDSLVEDFQFKYLDALADGKVASVNFDDFDQTDWEGIHAWALEHINTQNKHLFREIPPRREELLAMNKIEITESMPLRNLWNQSLQFTQSMKEEAWCSAVFGSTPPLSKFGEEPIIPKFPAEDEELDASIARAKSWALATVLTPQQSFDSLYTHQKLLKLSDTEAETEALLDQVMKRLQADKIVIKHDNGDVPTYPDGTALSGSRGWKVSTRYFDKFESNRMITATMLRDAGSYKITCLDTAFSDGGIVQLPKEIDLEDGKMMAIFNLVSMGMVTIKPGDDVPASRYGLDWENEGYKTRSMDKTILSFSTYLAATPTYAAGDPLTAFRETVVIPRGGIDQVDGLGLIPAWFDINHDFQPAVWEMVVGAVVGIVSLRPGIASTEIVRTLGWALSRYDCELVLHYLLACTVLRKVYDGWETTEWWWLILGPGHANGARWKFDA